MKGGFAPTILFLMKAKILCVDDDSFNLKAYDRILRSKHLIELANSPIEALEMVRKSNFDCIISDHSMPEMTGLELLKKVSQDSPQTQRILLSAQSDQEIIRQALIEAQVFRHIQKPFVLEELAIAVDQAIELKKLQGEKNSLTQAKKDFMILVNHELKTPLTAVLSFLDLLKETEMTEDQKLYLSHISKNADRLHDMTFEILQLLSVQTENLEMSKSTTQSLLSKSVSRFSQTANLKNLNFVIEDENHTVVADPQTLSTAVDNLVENAVKYAKENSSIVLKTEKNAMGRVQFQIENVGDPLNESTLQKIKEPFTTNENIMNHSKKLGIGLSLSEAILKKHQSELEISSQDGTIRVSFDLESES